VRVELAAKSVAKVLRTYGNAHFRGVAHAFIAVVDVFAAVDRGDSRIKIADPEDENAPT